MKSITKRNQQAYSLTFALGIVDQGERSKT